MLELESAFAALEKEREALVEATSAIHPQFTMNEISLLPELQYLTCNLLK